jgi:hypothetical protein
VIFLLDYHANVPYQTQCFILFSYMSSGKYQHRQILHLASASRFLGRQVLFVPGIMRCIFSPIASFVVIAASAAETAKKVVVVDVEVVVVVAAIVVVVNVVLAMIK